MWDKDWPAKYSCRVNCSGNQDLAGLQLHYCAIRFAHRGESGNGDDGNDYIVHNFSNDDYIVHNDDNDDYEDKEKEDECDS